MSVMNPDRAAMVREKRRPALFHRIQTRLIVAFSLLFVAVLTTVELTSIWGVPFTEYAGRKGQEEAHTFRTLGQIADVMKRRLLSVLEERSRDIHATVDSDVVRINVARLRAATRKARNAGLTGTNLRTAVRGEESYHVLTDYLDSLAAMHGAHDEALIADAETGTILVSLDRDDEGTSAALEPFFTGILQFRGAFLGDVTRCPIVGSLTMCFGKAVAGIDMETLDKEAGTLAAVLMLDIDVNEFIAPILQTGEGLVGTGEALLVNQKGRIITSLQHPLPDGTWAKPLEHAIHSQPAVLAAHGADGIVEAKDYRGEAVLAAYRHVRVTPEWGWGLVVKRDTSELFAPLRQDIAYSLAIGLAGVLAVVGMTVYLARSLTRPIAALSRTAERAADGDRTARAPVIGSDEVAGLATTFNTMLHRIQNWHTELERQVELRTAELRSRISEGEQAENELRKLSVAVEQSPAAVVITDTAGTIQYVNPRFTETTGYPAEEAIGQNQRILKSGDMSPDAYKRMWETIVAGEVWRGEFHNKKKNGELYWEAASISPIRNSKGTITHFLAIKEDTTDRKRAEEELRQAKESADAANNTKSEFLANMSHEIRTPMTAILGFADVLLEHGNIKDAPPERIEAVRTIKKNGEYLIGIINDILDLSKVEAGKMGVEQIACNPCKLIAEVASLAKLQADGRGLAFNIEYIGAVPETIQTDPTRLRQILINLIGNAIKFTEIGGVRLITRFVEDKDKPVMQFDVLDTGIGMTEEQVARLFQPFTQADASTTRKFGGTGLGLTISKRFAEMLDGDITVVDAQEGVGTRFRLTVTTGSLDGVRMIHDPLSATVVATEASTASADQPYVRGCRILLAEDGPDNQRLIAHFLKKAGAEVTVRDNGKLAVDAALTARDEGHPFDVILMDMQMPVMDGYEATGLLRRKGFTGPIIALTAHAMASDRQKCLDAGCDDYASKPIDRKKLIATIQEWRQKRPIPEKKRASLTATHETAEVFEP